MPSVRPQPRRGLATLSRLVFCGAASAAFLLSAGATAQSPELLAALNEPLGRVAPEARSATRVFTAYLDVTKPPRDVGPDFNQTTIYPGMEGFQAVSDWAAANEGMTKALLAVQNCKIFGVPYGTEGVDPKFVERGLVAVIAPDGDLTRMEFPYLKALETVSALVTADMYRLCEAGKFTEAFAIGVAHLRVMRQACDAEMFEEKSACMTMLADAMSVHRDLLYAYEAKMSFELLQNLGTKEYPLLKPGDNERLRRLEMPEGDLAVATELLKSVFDGDGQVEPQKFAKAFASKQAREAPLTTFGATKRWENVAPIHGSFPASSAKLAAIYDDWWRRWRMRPYDPLQALRTEWSAINPVKYAGVVFSARDIESLFALRRRVVTEFCGLVAGCGICAFRKDMRDTWPNDIEKCYTRYFPKRFNFDPYNREGGPMEFEFLGTSSRGIETEFGRVEVRGGCLLYALNDNHVSEDAKQHSPGGKIGDFVVWPPLRAVSRGQGR